jgi:hypothetical protein
MKKFAPPLQAFAALILCSSMAWMIFLVAGLDPAPPTAMDLQSRSTQDLSFASMNSTAVALAKQMLVNIAPSQPGRIFLPVTGRETATPGPMAAMTLRPVTDFLSTPTPFSLYKFFFPPTATRKKSDSPTSTAVHTPVPTKTLRPPTLPATSTSIPTNPPSTATDPPSTATDPPSTATDPPSTATNPPSTATNPPATATNPPPATATNPPPATATNPPPATATNPPPATIPPPQPTGTSAPIVVTQPAATQPAATQPADTQPPVTP